MKIVAAGGGSGGHVTPVLAVINELSKADPQLQVHFVCDRGFFEQSQQIMKQAAIPVQVRRIVAGKWRRYHGIPLVKQFFYWPTLWGNLKDLFKLGIGFWQSFWLLVWYRPDVVFTKGGFVCVPVGLAAAALHIPLVIHESEAQPGLTNRILARFATFIAIGAPLENYSYPKERSYYVGIPVAKAYTEASAAERVKLKRELGYDEHLPLLLITGGGTGAATLNAALSYSAQELTSLAQVVHLTGTGKMARVAEKVGQNRRYQLYEFVDQARMAQLVRAADVVVSRAGATTLLELASATKATIIVPNPRLTSGHQLKNAAVYERAKAAIVVQEETLSTEPGALKDVIIQLLTDEKKRRQLEQNMHQFAKPRAANEVAQLLIKAGKRRV